MSKHHYDKLGICLKCDLCDVPDCCEQTEECNGTNWAFMGRMNEFMMKIKEKRNL